MIDANDTLSRVATTHPASTLVFLRHRPDFCCWDGQKLGDACQAAGLDPELVFSGPSFRDRGHYPPYADLGDGGRRRAVVDILKALTANVHCQQCGDFNIDADVTAESQRLLAKGCPGPPYECPPELFATLLSQSALESLQTSWDALESAARGRARQTSLDDSPRVAPRPNDKLDQRTVARWEDDGGYIPTKRWSE